MKVIDLSKHNGAVNLLKAKADGVEGVILRVGLTGYGTAKTKRKDAMFEQYYSQAKAAGLLVGGYWYSCAYSVDEAQEEAKKAIEFCKGKQFEMPLFWDTEDAHDISERGVAKQNQLGMAREQLTNCALAFCQEVQKAGFIPGVYASKSWFNDSLDIEALSGAEKWVAHYTSKTLDYSSDFCMWQYSATGKVAGISGNCDLNICYADYRQKEDWQRKYEEMAAKIKALAAEC